MSFGDAFGGRKSQKQKKRETLEANRARGRAAERQAEVSSYLSGYEVERTGRGSDFRLTKRELFTGKVIERKLVEVKSGKAKLSELQRKTKKKKSNYKVFRVDIPLF
jgi:hypothetical protein